MFKENRPDIIQAENEQKKELEPLFEIIKKESLDLDYTFRLKNEVSRDGEEIKGEAFWFKIKEGEKCVEGKFYRPKNDSDSLIVFAQGMPGDAVTWFEEKHVKKLIEEGYDIIVPRHNGTKLKEENINNYVHSQERIARGLDSGQDNLGEQRIYALKELAEEYEIVLKLLADKFEEIKLIGHSGGVLNLAHSLTNLPPEITGRIKSFINLTGFIGKYNKEEDSFGSKDGFLVQDMKKYYKNCNTILNLQEPEKSIEAAKQMLDRIYNTQLPNNITYTHITSTREEYFSLALVKDFQNHVGGLRIIDETQFEPEYHDLKNLRTETLIRLLNINKPKSKHTATFSKKEPN